MKKAVCALIKSCDDHYLSVSRKDNPNDFGLPGGKVDEGETLEEACIREVFEETGLTISGLTPVFTQVCGPGKDGMSFEVTTFKVENASGEINTAETGIVSYVSKDKLINSSSFADYNEKLFVSLTL